MIKYYLELIKPRIIFANLISVIGGMFFCSIHYTNSFKFIFVLFATICIIGSACVFNNIIDMDIDCKMARTKHRVLVQSLLPLFHVKIYGIFLFLLGCFLFLLLVNFLTFLLSLFGFFIYVILYSLYLKRNSEYSVIFGGLSGAIPFMIGYCSITNYVDFKSIILFIMFVLWQVPHSYSIFIFRIEDYKSSCLPVISIIKGISRTIKEIIFYILCFEILVTLLYFFKYINLMGLIILSILNIFWFLTSVRCYISDSLYYARISFYFSLCVIVGLNMVLIFCSV
ncbi:heme o synthase [Buchnera aphidicola]|uniref:heme o synthase n=1 Tax=Buchnera aphidicola TaxID=9 RepID=UPI00346491B8